MHRFQIQELHTFLFLYEIYIQLKKREAGAADLPIGADCGAGKKLMRRAMWNSWCVSHTMIPNLKSTYNRLGSDGRRRHTQEFAIYCVYVTGRALIYCIPKHHCSLISLRICRRARAIVSFESAFCASPRPAGSTHMSLNGIDIHFVAALHLSPRRFFKTLFRLKSFFLYIHCVYATHLMRLCARNFPLGARESVSHQICRVGCFLIPAEATSARAAGQQSEMIYFSFWDFIEF